MHKIITVLFLIVVSCLWASPARAAEIVAQSANYADVKAAVDAAMPGDTVRVPAGTATWTTELLINKPLSIIGAGLNNEKTILTAGGPMPEGFFFIYGFTADTQVRVAGFEFNSVDWSTIYAIYVNGLLNGYNSDKIRIDHNVFNLCQFPIFFLHLVGLIDNNTFYNANIAITISAGSRNYADSSWSDLSAGKSKAIFIENNTFISNKNYPESFTNEQIGSMNGGKLVVRYNVFNGDSISLGDSRPFLPIMTHGSQGWAPGYYWQADDITTRGNKRGQPVVEIYNNTASALRLDFLVSIRGSANLIYNNSIISTVTHNPRIALAEEEYDSPSWGIHRTAWPAEDQVHNTFIWNNIYRGHDFNDGVYGFIYAEPNDLLAGLWKNRDYFLHEPQPTGGKEYFIGRNGASNTYPTDGIIYPTLGTMMFTPDGPNAYYPYVPYVYPHPLTVQGESGRLLGLSGTQVAGGTRLAWNAITGAVSYAVQRDWGSKTSVDAGVLTYTDNASGAMYLVEALDADGVILACEGVKTFSGLILNSPNGDEAWHKGETRAITWAAYNITGNLLIELLQNDTVVGTVAASVDAAAGSYTWSVGRLENGSFVSGSNLKIRISTAVGAVVAEQEIR